ncbi:MAG: hypothetical protein WC503_01075 [Candidatus Shapirobacteria bacterium]
MCEFFSFVSDPTKSKFLYFDWDLRQKVMFEDKDLKDYEPDSHTSIAHYFGYKAKEEDKLNKYEYDPLTKVFKIDQINGPDDSVKAKAWVKALDFSQIVKPLIIKPIIHPFEVKPPEIGPEILALLRKWDSVWVSVWDSVKASVWDSVGNSVQGSVWDSVRNSVWTSIWDSVRVSVWDSVKASVWDSVGNSVQGSVWDSVGAYTSSFFDIEYKHGFSPCTKLWEMGLVPSFDGKIWRLHGGPRAEVLWSGEIK